MTWLIVGCGRVGKGVAQRLNQGGAAVLGISRTPRCIEGIEWRPADLDRETVEPPGFRGSRVIYLVPPTPQGVKDARMERFLRQLDGPPDRFVLVSTTGVYGDRDGAWVTEEAAVDPQTDRAKRRLDAELEAGVYCARHGVDLAILRVAGIYGPSRWPLRRLEEGMVVLSADISPYSNRIHEVDLERIVVEAATNSSLTGVFNISDGLPSTMTEYFVEIARHFRLPEPRQVDWDEAGRTMSEGMLSYLSESRRISNRKWLESSGTELRFPNLGKALDADRVASGEGFDSSEE